VIPVATLHDNSEKYAESTRLGDNPESAPDQLLVELDDASFKRFVERLDAPAKVKPGLRRLLQGKSPWD
jgi:hypothetical protein